MIFKNFVRMSFLAAAVTLATTSVVVESQAQSTAALTPSALRTAAVLFSPLPNSSLLTPELVQHVERLAPRRDRWQIPTPEPIWKVDGGEPVVNTRRMDELWHTVKTTSKYKLLGQGVGPLASLQALNPDVDFDNLQEGQQIRVWKASDAVARSWGAANGGRLYDGEPLPPGEGYKILYPHRAFGTYYTVSEIVRVLDNYSGRFPDAKPLIVGDISVKTGRRLKPHKSHQSGRDVDITYPRHDEPPAYNRFHNIARRNFDVEKSFYLLKEFVDGGNVEYMFVDRRWQRLLREYGESQGASQEWLDTVFEYRSSRPSAALIRHERGHARHVHVRFKCQETDLRCR